jgi:hypothetical protein
MSFCNASEHLHWKSVLRWAFSALRIGVISVGDEAVGVEVSLESEVVDAEFELSLKHS